MDYWKISQKRRIEWFVILQLYKRRTFHVEQIQWQLYDTTIARNLINRDSS